MTNESKEIVVKEKNKKSKSRSGIAAVSFLISLLDRLGVVICNALANGFFGKIFTSHSALEQKFHNGIFGRLLFGGHSIRRIFRRIRKFFANIIDNCFFLSYWKKSIAYFCSIPLNFFGNFGFFFGIYTVVVYIVKLFVPGIGSADSDYLIIGVTLILASLPMLFSKVSLVYAVKTSVICGMIFKGAFGFSDESFDSKNVKIKSRGNYMLFLGLVAGVLTIFVHPLAIIVGILSVILLSLIAVSPEVGVLISVVVLPFLSLFNYPTLSLCLLIAITGFFYLIKLIRGKRVFRLELVDTFVLLFGVFIFISSFFSAGGNASTNAAGVTVLLLTGYFLFANLMRTEQWIKRCIWGLIGSASIVAFVGVAEYFIGDASSQWLDTSLFSDIRLRVVSFFENPNVLSTFLVLVFPFVLATFCLSVNKNERFLLTLVCAAFVACTVFTWSRGSWIAMIVTALVFFMMYNKKTFRVFGIALLVIPALPIILPENILNRLFSIANLSDSSISYRIYTWRGTLEAIKEYLFGGIGFGNEAFQNVYPMYAYSGIETAEHSHSLFLQILLGLGIGGLVLFCIIAFLSLQKFFEYVKSPESRCSKIFVTATISSVIGAMIMGVFDYIWYNYRVLYLFWIVIAIGCAFVRVGNYELDRKKEITYETEVNNERRSYE